MNRDCPLDFIIDEIHIALGLVDVFRSKYPPFFPEHIGVQTTCEDWEMMLETLATLRLNLSGQITQRHADEVCAIFQKLPVGELFLEFTRAESHFGFGFRTIHDFSTCREKLRFGTRPFQFLPEWNIETDSCKAFACRHTRTGKVVQFVWRAVPLADQITELPGE